LGNVEIRIAGIGDPVYRPYRNRFEIGDGVLDEFSELEFTRVPAVDGGIAALGWVLHHSYKGAIPRRTKIKGLRLRRGNIQVGEDDLMEDLFPEPRFNSWSVGEVHVVDDRIVPNGRRDHFEQNVHYDNLVNHISPVARTISSRCRANSLRRNWLREFERQRLSAMDTIAIIRQGAVSSAAHKQLELRIKDAISEMERISGCELLAMESAGTLRPTVRALRRQFAMIEGANHRAKPLEKMPAQKRRVYEQVFGLIYECSPTATTAKGLIDRIMTRLS
jgi:hypothetical protein